MNCPRCASAVLDERERNGIQVDVCPSCRGVWLDRGELERLIAKATQEIDDEIAALGQRAPARDIAARSQEPRRVRHDDDDDDEDDHRRDGRTPRRRRWFEMFDMFD